MPVVNVEENIKKEQAANASVTPAELKAYFINLYQDLAGLNPAVAGLALWVNWSAAQIPTLQAPPMPTTGLI